MDRGRYQVASSRGCVLVDRLLDHHGDIVRLKGEMFGKLDRDQKSGSGIRKRTTYGGEGGVV